MDLELHCGSPLLCAKSFSNRREHEAAKFRRERQTSNKCGAEKLYNSQTMALAIRL